MMHEPQELELAARRQREQMLKLVTKAFYNELTNYGVRSGEIVRVASHLLDNLMQRHHPLGEDVEYYNRIFTLLDVEDAWDERRVLTVQGVSLRPLEAGLVSEVWEWLGSAQVRDSFMPRFPANRADLQAYFATRAREYFGIYYSGQPVGIIGAESYDADAAKLEMRKLIGKPGLRGKGIGKRATFAFLYYAFMRLNVNKVYIHSADVNIRNIGLNSRFGFEVEGVFQDEFRVGAKRQHVVRMALFRSLWLEIFGRAAVPPAEMAV